METSDSIWDGASIRRAFADYFHCTGGTITCLSPLKVVGLDSLIPPMRRWNLEPWYRSWDSYYPERVSSTDITVEGMTWMWQNRGRAWQIEWVDEDEIPMKKGTHPFTLHFGVHSDSNRAIFKLTSPDSTMVTVSFMPGEWFDCLLIPRSRMPEVELILPQTSKWKKGEISEASAEYFISLDTHLKVRRSEKTSITQF